MANRINFASVLLCGCIFASGACGIILEYIQASLASMILGNSFEQWALVIGLMLFWMGFASLLQVHISKRFLIYTFIAVETALALFGGYSPTLTYAAYGYTGHYILVLYFFVSFIGIMIGLEIPVIIRINNDYTKELKTNVGNVLSADYLGSLAGALIYVFLLLRFMPITEAAFLTAMVNFTLAFVTYVYFLKKRLIKSLVPAAVMIVTMGLIVFGYVHNREWNIRLEQPLYDDPVVHSGTSRYQHIVMTRYEPLDETRLFLNGNLQLCSLDEMRYHEPLVHPVMNAAKIRKRVLILGGGDGCALREVLKYEDVRQVMLVDLDPAMTKLAAEHPLLTEINADAFQDARVIRKGLSGTGPGEPRKIFQNTGRIDRETGLPETRQVARVSVMNVDADRFLSDVPGYWDVIIVDMPDPSTPELAKLYSKRFYAKARRHLSARGLMAVQATSPYFAKESFLCIGRTLESAGFSTLPFHENVPSFGDWGWYMAWSKDLDYAKVRKRVENIEFTVPTRFLTEERFKAEMSFGKGMLDSDRTSVNTIMNPVLLSIYNNECWQLN